MPSLFVGFCIHFLKLIVIYILFVIYVREDNGSMQCIGYGYTACMDYMDPDVRCPQKAVKLNHSLTPIVYIKYIPGITYST